MEINIPQRKNNKTFKFIIIFVVLGVFFAILRIMFLYYMTSIKEIEVPDVLGLKYYEAVKLLTDLKLKPVLGAQRQSRKYDIDTVMEVIPAPGRKVKEGNKIFLTVSSGIKKINMPELIGETLRTAQRLAIENNFKLEEEGQYSLTIEEGEIVSQNPKAGEDLEDGATVNILVSLGYPVRMKAISIGKAQGESQYLVKITIMIPEIWDAAEVVAQIKIEGVETKLFQGTVNSGEKK